MGKCKYLAENEGKLKFDELEECPRHLSGFEQCILLKALATELCDFGDRLEHFVDEYEGNEAHVPIGKFFDGYYKPLYKSFRDMEHAMNRCYKVTYTHFLGENY